jgi:L-aspartate oxidase
MTGPALRCLPATRPVWEWEADVVVAGSGAAGMSAALAAAGHGRQVLLVSKDGLGDGSTPLAQGGLAAAVGDGDSTRLHERDTLTAGAGLCDPAAVADLVAGAPAEIFRLLRLGARLDSTALHLEGGHSRARVVRAGGDAAGAEVHRVLAAALRRSPVEVVTHCAALDLLTDGLGRAAGLLLGLAGDSQTQAPRGQGLSTGVVRASAVVLATGGFGQAFGTTTNPPGLTGDGLALAARAGADLRDLEFVQFHPTVLWQEAATGQRPLITEALRGAGAVLVDSAGQQIMAGRHPLGDLAPRDVVAAAVTERLNGQPHVWLDATSLGHATLERDFPTVTAACRARGIDPAAEPVPVAPGAHYACGGIAAGLDGRTSVPGLFAVGEAAATGVHGANRLASNSLTEALLAGHRAGDLLGRELPRPGTVLVPPPTGTGVSPAAVPVLTAAMSAHAGVVRDPVELEGLLATLARAPAADGALDLATVEATSLHTVAALVAVAALARAESRGCHRWRGVPPSEAGQGSSSVWRCDGGQVRPAAPASARAEAVA